MMQRRESQKIKLCISIEAETVKLLAEKANKARRYRPSLLEFRLDYLKRLDFEKLESLKRLIRGDEILTIRSPIEGGVYKDSESKRVFLVRSGLISLKPKFIDIEISTLKKDPQVLRDIERSNTKLIASFHDTKGDRDFEDLLDVTSQAPKISKSLYAIKIVSAARSIKDNQKVLNLYSEPQFNAKNSPRLVAFCTGKPGVDSRIECLFAGSPFSYCSLPGEPLASGQLDIENMRKAIAKRESEQSGQN